jgi:photosystem II stability/assembly factor-like uncharacterized protein
MKNKKFIIIIALSLLSASCNLFSTPTAAGVFKSSNGGVDWLASNALKTGTGNILQYNISKLDFDPANRQNIFAASYNGGIYESEDSGATWTNILAKIGVYDFAIDPANSKVIYAAGICLSNSCVLKTTDGGGSWVNVPGYTGPLADPVRSIALNPSDPNQIVIGTLTGNVIKSADGGSTWQLAKNFKDQVNSVKWQGSTIYVLLKDNGLFESPDFGASFSEATTGIKKAAVLDVLGNPQNGVADFLQVYVDSETANLIYISTDKGLYKTVDGGTTWNLLTLPTTAAAGVTRSIAVAKSSSDTVYASVGATIYKSLDGGNTWQTQGINTTGFVNSILIDPQLPQIVYSGIFTSQQQ